MPTHPPLPRNTPTSIRAAGAIQLVLHWEACTISRGGWSILERLGRRFPGVDLR
jgi:hypothetical protein